MLVGFAMYFLWQTIGVSCLAGLAVLIILVPVNGLFLANRVRKLQVLINNLINTLFVLLVFVAVVLTYMHYNYRCYK